jgi:hypothetical protein
MGVGELKKACPPLDGRFFQVPRRDLSGGMLGLLAFSLLIVDVENFTLNLSRKRCFSWRRV